MKYLFVVFSFFVMSQFSIAQVVPNYDKEKRWAEQVEDGIMDGDVVWIESNNHSFLSIFTPSEADSRKTAIIIHGIGVHPDWAQVIQPLRVALTEEGFSTLSIQMPVLDNGVESKEYIDLFPRADGRIIAATNYLKQQGLDVDLLVAHSLGTAMSSHYLANNQHDFNKFVAVGMSGMAVEYLPKINIPVFDVYGTEDITPVLESVTARASAASNNKNYQQKMIQGDHFFNDQDELLVQTVIEWLK